MERIKRGLSQQKLGELAGCTGRTIRYIEANKRLPSLSTADAILKVLGIKVTIGKE